MSSPYKYRDIYDACVQFTSGRKISSIVDLGARYGEGYELFGRHHPDASYTFVEPSNRCIPNINRLIEKYSDVNLRLIDGILGSRDGEAEFYQLDNDNDQSGNLFSDRNGQYGSATIQRVKVYDFKNFFDKIDFLKCNIEGGEYQLIEDGFFDMVDSFVMEAHNMHVPNKTYQNVVQSLQQSFDLEVWGNTHYKYCFINGQRKRI